MLLKKIWTYLRGYCVILVEGPRKESLINLALLREINLWDIRQDKQERLWLKVLVEDVKKLRHVARTSRCSFKIVAKRGMPFLAWRAAKRKGLLLGVLLFFGSLYCLSSFIWFIDVFSVKPLQHLQAEKVVAEAANLGLKPGVFKSSLNISRLEKELGYRLPETTFISIEIQGTRAKIEVVEKQIITEAEKSMPAHIVATKDGVVEEILVLAGEPRVVEGDTVQKGQVLISGIVPVKTIDQQTGAAIITNDPPKIVRARGIIRARVWYEAVESVDLIQKLEVATGRKLTQTCLKIGEKVIILKGPKQVPYKLYASQVVTRKYNYWRNSDSTVEVIQTTYLEKKVYYSNLDEDGAVSKALTLAKARLEQQIPAGARIVDQRIERLAAEPGQVRVKVWMEVWEDIGKTQQFEIVN